MSLGVFTLGLGKLTADEGHETRLKTLKKNHVTFGLRILRFLSHNATNSICLSDSFSNSLIPVNDES